MTCNGRDKIENVNILHQVTFLISAMPPGCTFQLWLHFSHLWTSSKKKAPQIFDMLCINKFQWNFALCIAGILKLISTMTQILQIISLPVGYLHFHLKYSATNHPAPRTVIPTPSHYYWGRGSSTSVRGVVTRKLYFQQIINKLSLVKNEHYFSFCSHMLCIGLVVIFQIQWHLVRLEKLETSDDHGPYPLISLSLKTPIFMATRWLSESNYSS